MFFLVLRMERLAKIPLWGNSWTMTEEDNEVPRWAPRSIWYDSEYFLELKVTVQLRSWLTTFRESGFLPRQLQQNMKHHPQPCKCWPLPLLLIFRKWERVFTSPSSVSVVFGHAEFKLALEINTCMHENSSGLSSYVAYCLKWNS